MKVYAILEHQLNSRGDVIGTRIAEICSTSVIAESKKEDWKFSDAHLVKYLGGDPCVYEIEEWEVT